MRIYYHPQFRRSYQKLPREIQEKAEIKETLFRRNPFDPSLKTHKLHGRLKNQWSFSVDRRYRIVFEFSKNDAVFLAIGDHDVYQ